MSIRTAIRPLVAGNWKMNGLTAALDEAAAVAAAIAHDPVRADVVVCPPATLIRPMADRLAGTSVALGGQDCHPGQAGAHTGDISAMMLHDAGARFVILGHSERRADHFETSALVRAKAAAAVAAGLIPIVCVGETAGERQAGLTMDVVTRQLSGSLADTATPDRMVVAYEPVWAIGTGLTPTVTDVAAVHAELRSILVQRFGEPGDAFRLLYGGSVKGSNARDLMAVANVDGALVGGASLKAADFLAVLAAYHD